jgi:PTH1 family peptidyl-tRNA hydrolase
MENLTLIVGLGNPGAKYARTRHNVGFQLLEHLAGRWHSAAWLEKKKFQSSVSRAERNSRVMLLARPQTFMNASGEAVAAMQAWYRLPLPRLLVAVDDADLPLGEIRLRARGSSGGHHGLESIEARLGTRDFARLRIGIGRAAEGRREIADYVLAPFTQAEAGLVDEVLTAATMMVECWLDDGIEKAMSRYNGVVNRPPNKGKTE